MRIAIGTACHRGHGRHRETAGSSRSVRSVPPRREGSRAGARAGPRSVIPPLGVLGDGDLDRHSGSRPRSSEVSTRTRWVVARRAQSVSGSAVGGEWDRIASGSGMEMSRRTSSGTMASGDGAQRLDEDGTPPSGWFPPRGWFRNPTSALRPRAVSGADGSAGRLKVRSVRTTAQSLLHPGGLSGFSGLVTAWDNAFAGTAARSRCVLGAGWTM